MQRIGQIIGIKPEAIEEYERLHGAVWPEVLATIHACNIHNYSIFRHGTTLFAYFEYIGDDFAADMAEMAEDPKTREWWTYSSKKASVILHTPSSLLDSYGDRTG